MYLFKLISNAVMIFIGNLSKGVKKGPQMAYRPQNGPVRKIVKLLIALALLPSDKAHEGFLVSGNIQHKKECNTVLLSFFFCFLKQFGERPTNCWLTKVSL